MQYSFAVNLSKGKGSSYSGSLTITDGNKLLHDRSVSYAYAMFTDRGFPVLLGKTVYSLIFYNDGKPVYQVVTEAEGSNSYYFTGKGVKLNKESQQGFNLISRHIGPLLRDELPLSMTPNAIVTRVERGMYGADSLSSESSVDVKLDLTDAEIRLVQAVIKL